MTALPPRSSLPREALVTRITGLSGTSGVDVGTVCRATAAGLLMTAAALVLLGVGLITAFQARRVYAAGARVVSLAILRIFGVRFVVHAAAPFPRRQVVYISNHTSTLDLFLLVALGLPRTRFFLSGFLQKFVPLGIIARLMGTFFTVPQDRPLERRGIFQRAARVLRRTGESVYLSPEGGRITTGEIGHFNKGAFHLATDLGVPIVPMYLRIPRGVDPGLGYDARPGTVHVHVLPEIDTRAWTVEALPQNVAAVRDLFVRVHGELQCA